MKLCLPCPGGKVALSQGASECFSCPPGQRAVGTFQCQPCPTGHIVTPNGTCDPCPAGTFARDNECLYCPVGEYSPFSGMSECRPCPPGSYQDETGSSSCKLCVVDSVTSSNSTTFCVSCPKGKGTYRPGDPECVDESVLPGGNGRGHSMDLQTMMIWLATLCAILLVVASGSILAIKFLDWHHTKPDPASKEAHNESSFEIEHKDPELDPTV